jgi:uncharacterized protein YqjF (DUF2071 family)
MSTKPTQVTEAQATERAVGYQRWSDLLFVHWRLPADVVAASLPRQLTVDTWDGDAWLGLVLFQMSGVRPWWSCAWPWLSSFPETNLRTYVRHRGGEPGVWFISLEAANPIAVWIARRRWWLNYFWAQMQIERRGASIRYTSRRHKEARDIGTRVVAEFEPGTQTASTFHAEPGTLEHFLIERYALYTLSNHGALFRGHVRHTPYPLQQARLTECQENLVAAAGLPSPREPPCHVIFSPGVSVGILSLRAVE